MLLGKFDRDKTVLYRGTLSEGLKARVKFLVVKFIIGFGATTINLTIRFRVTGDSLVSVLLYRTALIGYIDCNRVN